MVHLPKLALACGSFGRFGCMACAGTGSAHWEMPEDEAELITPGLRDCFDCGIESGAARALIVSVLDQYDLGIGASLDVVAVGICTQESCS
jgi:hypothetical protein